MPPLSEERDDEILRTGILFRRPINQQFSAEIGYRYTNWDSNVDFYKYDQHFAYLLATYRY